MRAGRRTRFRKPGGRIRRVRRAAIAAAIAAASAMAGLAGAAPAPAQPTWRLEQPAPPPGATFKVPLGAPGDLQCWARNRCLLAVEGNAAVPRGLFLYDGVSWRQYTTVCGGTADTTRIAWAGPTEFWIVTAPSQPRIGSGTALCHVKDGQVVGSFSTPDQSADPFRQMTAAACAGPNDCWFAGVGSADPTGSRVGAFHLRWDGATLTTSYGPQGRGVSDLVAVPGGLIESTFVGRRAENTTEPVELAEPETPKPRLLHTVVAGQFANDPFTPADISGVPADGTELLALSTDGSETWAGGGGAASGPAPATDGAVARPPIALRRNPVVGQWFELPLDAGLFGATDRIADLAVLPGTTTALAAVQPFADRRSANAKATVALIQGDGTAAVTRLPVSGAGRGSATKVACPAPNDCWLATYGGWLFHYTDGSPVPQDTDPAFAQPITFRPNEAAEQFIPDAPPADDSQLFAPPAVVPEKPRPATQAKRGKPLPPALRGVRSTVRGRTLILRFRVVRRVRLALIASRGARVVARTPKRLFAPGSRTVRLKLNPKRWPTRLRFDLTEVGRTAPTTGGGDDVVTT